MCMLQGTVAAIATVPLVRPAPALADSALIRSPLPGGVGAFVRVVLNAPPWMQVSAIALGGATVGGLLIWLWIIRERWLRWLVRRSLGMKIGLTAVAALAITGAASFGVASWNYTQHNNDFCIGCHVMGTAWTRFQHSEHRKLKCHDCHQQSLFASMRQLYLWVAERPNEIPPHAKVPTGICEGCHEQAHADSAWKHVMATAGHSTHLRNDKPALRNIQCVTCHGAEVHHFVPVDKTCGQAGCHENTHIQLGKMAGQTSLHCTGCHAFTQRVADNLSPDSTRLSLVPNGGKCLDCHAMEKRLSATLAEFSPSKEPHKAVCGACHDPHKQQAPRTAYQSCATAQCHARPDTLTPFHRGLPAGGLADCGSCHKPHVWKIQSTDCRSCHRTPPADRRSLGTGPPDTTRFSHARHTNLPCTSCHSSETSHGEVTIRQPDGCESCHHAPSQRVTCTTCHTSLVSRPQTAAVSMTVWNAPRARVLPFAHDRHSTVACRTCHTASLTLAATAQCASCHADHHQAAANCASCHPAVPVTEQRNHPRASAHAGCGGSGCHRDAAVLALPAVRTVCLSCHRDKIDHKAGAECASCHLVDWGGLPDGGSR